MAEFEFGGMTFKGGKMFVVLTALSTLGGGLWGGFEFYKDYMDMKEIIQNIDIDAIAAENALVQQSLDAAIEYTRDIRDDLRGDIIGIEGEVRRLEDIVDQSEQRIREAQGSIQTTLDGVRNEMAEVQRDVTASIREVEATVRGSERDVRTTMRETEDRLDADMRALEQDLSERLQEALENPLAN